MIETVGSYSPLWNCQTLVMTTLLSHAKGMVGFSVVVAFIGMAPAIFMLTLATAATIIATSMTTIFWVARLWFMGRTTSFKDITRKVMTTPDLLGRRLPRF